VDAWRLVEGESEAAVAAMPRPVPVNADARFAN
jgi:hypothetical protein